MDQPVQRFPANTRVRLREGVDSGFYGGLARVGCEGWVRRRKREKYGFPQVLIEWDKDHWAYNGQEDCWTWEGHFEAVEEVEMSETPAEQPQEEKVPSAQEAFDAEVTDITAAFVRTLYKIIAKHRGEPDPDPSPDEPQAEVEEKPAVGSEEEWQKLINESKKLLDKTPAYVVIALDRIHPPGAPPMIVPRVFHGSREPEYALVVQAQLATILAGFTEQTVSRILQEKSSNGES